MLFFVVAAVMVSGVDGAYLGGVIAAAHSALLLLLLSLVFGSRGRANVDHDDVQYC